MVLFRRVFILILKFKPECPLGRQIGRQSRTFSSSCHMTRTLVGVIRPLETEEEKTFSQMK